MLKRVKDMTPEEHRKHNSWYKSSPSAKVSHSVSSMIWANKNKDTRKRSRRYRLRSYCKNFILNKATARDLRSLKTLVDRKAEEIEGVER